MRWSSQHRVLALAVASAGCPGVCEAGAPALADKLSLAVTPDSITGPGTRLQGRTS